MERELSESFYSKDPKEVARDLLGKILINETEEGTVKGRIVETEAYYGEKDPASHAYRGKTGRTEIMWGKPGIAYVYFTYGKYYLFNVVAHKEGEAGAVLIRAVEPMEGISLMQKRRGKKEIKGLTKGPAKLTQSFKIDNKENGIDLTKGNFRIEEREEKDFNIISCTRVGIKRGKKEALRFYIENNEFVSKK
ncbi:MAG: DNA-3-methyladenine glycosylase [Candidatus Aerophobetes bacterium]|nr:DNA-3-methyladenine glycosylase [Candidatus Aerophobetes bacterium]